ncbi:MAG: DUF4405 domain-containing protein [Synergistaceae bacterium]|nr:DUF4405 domain-containing protein [Synergistaceae bacterium]
MTLDLMLLMSLQVAEHEAHEYLGMIFGALVIIHTYLNRNWYFALFRGKYNLMRAFRTLVNISLMISLALTIFSGIIMSETLPALNIESLISFARVSHLSSSYLSFVLMGIHTGLHWSMIAGKIKSRWPAVLAIILSGYGLYVFINADIMSYITLRNQFAFVDYDKNFIAAILENLAIFAFFTLAGYQFSKILTRKFFTPCVIIALTVLTYFIFRACLGVQGGGF